MNEIKQQERILEFSGCKLTPKGAIFEKDITFDQWQNIGGTLRYLEKSVLFWIGDWINFGEKAYGEKYAQAIESTGYELKTLQNAAYVSSSVETSRRREDVLFSHHAEVASLPPKEQEKWLEKVSSEKISVIDLRKAIQKERFSKKAILPNDKYRVIYADPPWSYSDSKQHLTKTSASNHYPTMSIEGLCAMPVSGICDDDCVLFIWTTSPLLEESFSVIKAWGFEYKTSFVWDKIKHNMGHYNSVRHEFLLVCTKGQYTPENKKLFDSVISIERTEKHSQKPKEVRDMIDVLYPSGKRIELFAREKFKGWDSYGNEL